ILGSTDLRCDDREAERAGPRLSLAHFQHGVWAADVEQDRQCAETGEDLARHSRRLLARSVCWIDKPVMLPPGRASEATRPVPTGSPAAANTIGMTAVAFFAAMDDGVP